MAPEDSAQDSSFYPIVPKNRRRFVGEIQGTTKRRLEGLRKMVQETARKLVFEIHVDTLKASKGWFFRFLTRNRLALRKTKTKTQKSNIHKDN